MSDFEEDDPHGEKQGFITRLEVQAHHPEFSLPLIVVRGEENAIRSLLSAFKRGGLETRLIEVNESFRLIEQSDGYAK